MSDLLSEIENALDGKPPPEAGAAIEEAIAGEVAAEEVAAAGVSITAIEFFPVVVILGMLAAAAAWLRPQWKATTHHHHSLLWRVVTWPARKVEQGITDLEHRVEHAMSHWLQPKTRLIAHWLNSTTHIVHVLTADMSELADNVHEALTFLRHHVIPQMIVAAARPMVRAIEAVTAKVSALEVRLQRAIDSAADVLMGVGVSVEHSMAGVLTGIAALVAPIYTEVYETLVPTVKELQTEVKRLTVKIAGVASDLYTDVYPRITRMENLLAPAAFAAAVAAALGTAWRNLSCRNTQNVASELCAADPNLVNDALGLLAGVLALLSLREYVELMQGVVGETTSLVHDLLRV